MGYPNKKTNSAGGGGNINRKLQESKKKELEFPSMINKKILWNFHESWFLVLEIPTGVILFGVISRGEASFCLEFPGVT